jgi:hypothetical protein
MALHIAAAIRFATTALLSVALASGTLFSKAVAQTLTNPNFATRNTKPPVSKSAGTKQMKACPEYGAGFARMPGSDACIKVGGFVEGGVVERSH